MAAHRWCRREGGATGGVGAVGVTGAGQPSARRTSRTCSATRAAESP
jgi:hypothetical protein